MVEYTLKFCRKCGEEKPVTEFYKKGSNKYLSPCKSCCAKVSLAWKTNNPEARKLIVNNYTKRHKNKIVENQVRYQIKYPQKYLCKAAQDRARKQGVFFDLKFEDIIIPEVCPVFNKPFERNSPYAASLDRIEPDRGYVKDNIQVISKLANTMKSSATQEQLKEFAKWVLKNE